MFKLIQRKFVVVDEKMAQYLLGINTYENQRTMREDKIKHYIKEMLDGKWLTGWAATAKLGYEDNKVVLVNGQHQAKAVEESGEKITVAFEEYFCATPKDLSDLFSRFDTNYIRTLSQLLGPEAAAFEIEWKKRIRDLVVSAAALGDSRIRAEAGLSTNDRKDLLYKNIVEGNFVNHVLQDGPSCKHMKRASVVRAMMDTFKVDKKAAEVFWVQTRDGNLLTQYHPAKRLRDYLTSNQQSTDSGRREMYVKCIHAWNAFVSQERTALKYSALTAIPKIKTSK